VQEGVNGHLLPVDANADDYANLIWQVWSDQAQYMRLRQSSRTIYEQVLNWDRWLTAMAPIIEGATN
jgi:hypothetical protein